MRYVIILVLICLLGCGAVNPMAPNERDTSSDKTPPPTVGVEPDVDCYWTEPTKVVGDGTGVMGYHTLLFGAPCNECEWVPLDFQLEIVQIIPSIQYEITCFGEPVNGGYVDVCNEGTAVIYFYPYFTSYPTDYAIGDTWSFSLTS